MNAIRLICLVFVICNGSISRADASSLNDVKIYERDNNAVDTDEDVVGIKTDEDAVGIRNDTPDTNDELSCQEHLGLEDGRIKDSQITASSQYNGNTPPKNGRLNYQGYTWHPTNADANAKTAWIQADLGVSKLVTGVKIQGGNTQSYWVTQFNVQYSSDGNNWMYVEQLNNNQPMIFYGNTDKTTVVTALFPARVTAAFIRIRPTAWHSYINLRFEVLGCEDECASSPCLNGGTCESEIDSFTCYCTPEYSGDQCEIKHGAGPFIPAPGTIDPLNPKPKVTDCYDILQLGQTSSGIYDIFPFNGEYSVRVWCDMDTDGGGWTVFQRREDGSEDFYREWEYYKHGFGLVSAEFWLGNEHISKITHQDNYELRIDMSDFNGEQRCAKYEHFRMDDFESNYRLLAGLYNGSAGDSFGNMRNAEFGTQDVDNDDKDDYNCAINRRGGFWYSSCGKAHLNGEYLGGPVSDGQYQGIIWKTWKGDKYSLKRTEMKIRPYRVELKC